MNNFNLIIKNKKAYFDYEVIDNWEAGIELFGHEVKSIRSKQVNLKGSYISFVGGHSVIKGLHITPWKTLTNRQNLSGNRDRNIFLHKKIINLLNSKQKEAGISIIPLELYFKGSLIKVKVGLCKGRKEYNKKQILKERSIEKETKIMFNKMNKF